MPGPDRLEARPGEESFFQRGAEGNVRARKLLPHTRAQHVLSTAKAGARSPPVRSEEEPHGRLSYSVAMTSRPP